MICSQSVLAENSDDQIFDRLAKSQQIAYAGKRTIIHWSDGESRSHEETIIFRPPNVKIFNMIFADRDRGQKRDRHRKAMRSPRPSFIIQNVEIMRRNYGLKRISDGEKILDFATDLVEIAPRSDGKPKLKIWISRENNAILRGEIFKFDGNLAKMFVFTEVTFSAEEIAKRIAKHRDRIPQDRRKPKSISIENAEKILTNFRLPKKLDYGFELQEIQKIDFPRGEKAIHARFTDGVFPISLFVSSSLDRGKPRRRGNRDLKSAEKIKIGSTDVFVFSRNNLKIYRWFHDRYHCTLIAPIGRSEVAQIISTIINN